jgi:hypothetical protein
MSSLQDKLYNYEQSPPAKAWDKIAAALDESHITDEFPSKLYNAEAIPPANAWDKIAGALETEEAPVVAMRGKTFSFFRYAAAAVLIGLVAFAVVKWMNKSTDKAANGIAVSKVNTESSKPTDTIIEQNTTATVIAPEDGNDVVNVQPKVRTRKIKDKYTDAAGTINDVEPMYAYNEHTPNLADRYIMLMTPDGGIIRVSKKWGDLVCCVSGQEQDANCKDQLKKWQEKIACSPVTTSPGNFMDILSLVSSLNDTEL